MSRPSRPAVAVTVTALVAVGINLLIYLLGVHAGWVDHAILFPDGRPLSAIRVAIVTTLFVLAAYGAFTALRRWRRPTLRRDFVRLAALAAAISLAVPLVIAEITTEQLLVMDAMHLATAAVVLVGFRTIPVNAHRRSPRPSSEGA